MISPRPYAAQCWIGRLEFDRFDNLLVGHELHEATMICVGVRGRLASSGPLFVGERDPKEAALAGVELMYVAGHAGRHFPLRNRLRIEQRAIDNRAGRTDMAMDSR